MSVSIIGGQWKGRRLAAPPGQHTRPLLGRIKQSLFDILGQRLDGLHVLDVCAGSGSFGFEAASRGAESVTFIENDTTAISTLQHNMALLGNPAGCTIAAGRFQDHLPGIDNADLIYADPPFPWYRQDRPQLKELLTLSAHALQVDGRLLIRGDRGQELPTLPPELVENFHKHYGRSWVAQFNISNQ